MSDLNDDFCAAEAPRDVRRPRQLVVVEFSHGYHAISPEDLPKLLAIVSRSMTVDYPRDHNERAEYGEPFEPAATPRPAIHAATLRVINPRGTCARMSKAKADAEAAEQAVVQQAAE